MSTTTDVRSADLAQLRAVLETQRAQRHDIVVSAAHMHAEGGRVYVDGDRLEVLNEDGVSVVESPRYDVTEVATDGFSSKLNIPRSYLRRLHAEHVELWDQNVNGWLRHESKIGNKYLLRTLRDGQTGEGVARAVLTNGYRVIENLDVLVAALQGIAAAGVQVSIRRCDLTERRMYVSLTAPEVAVEAPRLLDGYRGPWHVSGLAERRIITPDEAASYRTGGDPDGTASGEGAHRGFYQPGTEPLVFGGMVMSNSDVGEGAFSLSGQLMVLRCTNGMTIPAGRLRKVHIGDRHEVGAIDWSNRTNEAMLKVITEQTRDAVRTFLSPEYVAAQIADMEERAGVAITHPEETVKAVTKDLSYSETVANDVFAHFIAGGQLTAGGVAQAVTSVAQTVRSGDDAASMEADGLRALDLAVKHA